MSYLVGEKSPPQAICSAYGLLLAPKLLPHFHEDMVWECNGRETQFLCNDVPKQMLQQVQHMVWEQGVAVYLKAIFQTAKMLP
ncbi:MAG: hypothetical protein UZ01_00385 [Candidatus Brocadia sinica]|nr:MAG: hypothetical protein UZ01_00385 [Candidatus Brocadia sinica]